MPTHCTGIRSPGRTEERLLIKQCQLAFTESLQFNLNTQAGGAVGQAPSPSSELQAQQLTNTAPSFLPTASLLEVLYLFIYWGGGAFFL